VSARWRKVCGDLRESRVRSLLTALAIGVGVAAVMAAFSARSILSREVAASYRGANPAAAILWLDAVEPALVETVSKQPGVVAAAARRLVRARVEIAPGEWRPLLLFGVDDFNAQTVSIFRHASGAWPPRDGEVLVEQSALPVLRTKLGDTLHLRAPGGTIADVPISGIVHDPTLAPGWQDHAGYAFTSAATLARLGQGAHLDELRIAFAPGVERAEAARRAAQLADWLRAEGRDVRRIEAPALEHPHADHMRAMLLLLQTFALLALLLSGVLSANGIAAILARQVRQIGILKAIGATRRQVAGIYLGGVTLLALAGVGVGLPVGVLLVRAFARFAASQLNLELASLAIPLAPFAIAGLLGLGVPLLAAALPVRRAVRLSAREAIQLAGAPATAAVPGALGRVPFSSTVTALAFRGALRQPVRLWLTLAALALGGALLLTAANVHRSLIHAVDLALAARGDDVEARLARPVPAEGLRELAHQLGGVRHVEAWGGVLVSVALDGAVGTARYTLLAPPVESRLHAPKLVAGQWPGAAESGWVVVNRNVQAREPALRLGKTITLLAGDRKTTARIAGIVEEIAVPALYTDARTLASLAGAADTAGALRIVATPGEAQAVATALEESLAARGWLPTYLMTRDTLRRAMVDHFLILLVLLGLAALAAVIVGALGLATSISLAVVERSREIGILRALGATPRIIFRLVLMESAAVAGASALLAAAFALPLSAVVGHVVGEHGLHLALPRVIAPWALAAWVVLAGIITLAAACWPARAAVRLPVRETLACE
jgi:putative ABC transport system permease protein